MGIEPLTKAYEATPVGLDSWVKHEPGAPLEEFQVVVAAAEAWQAVRHIAIVELRHEVRSGRALINALRFRRLR
jgi:hypothetical protein